MVETTNFSTKKIVKSMPRKFHRFSAEIFGGSENDCNSLKILKWEHTNKREYRQGNLFFCLINDAV